LFFLEKNSPKNRAFVADYSCSKNVFHKMMKIHHKKIKIKIKILAA